MVTELPAGGGDNGMLGGSSVGVGPAKAVPLGVGEAIGALPEVVGETEGVRIERCVAVACAAGTVRVGEACTAWLGRGVGEFSGPGYGPSNASVGLATGPGYDPSLALVGNGFVSGPGYPESSVSVGVGDSGVAVALASSATIGEGVIEGETIGLAIGEAVSVGAMTCIEGCG